ncbi:ATP-dependent zinc metalloprotease FtsH [Solirubrobacter soli]|uniref:ATP-dependent zinc metalloprotease FtsH n=1 Tax=Solirubrobacter soli TaxID=363832 RepID=UPI0004292141|nr:ATP-dependent zinc metalloprotease FtsH [Solirubrobacter soli]
MPRLPGGRTFWIVVLSLLAINYLSVALFAPGKARSVTIPYDAPTGPAGFVQQVTNNNVTKIKTQGASVEGEFKNEVKFPNDKADPVKNFETELPSFVIYNNADLNKLLTEHKVTTSATPINDGRGFFTNLILGFGPVILLVVLFVWLSRRAAGGQMGAIGNFGRSRARRVEGGDQRVTFKDVAGIDEAKGELTEVVDFLKNPEKYQKLGGRIPRGVLLAGRPGTGKTLLARAVAGEAEVPFFSVSASEFVEAIVGIGASRVRDLFKQAKEAAPAIIFIDELDAIGRARSAGNTFGGGNDEREQTLNQILTEMDGFETGDTVIVLGATNRAEILDQALLRPGRFDRRVTVPPPDKDGRRKILEVHTRSLPLDSDVDLDDIAAISPGMVGADIANLANEAALLAARRGHNKVSRLDFTDSLEKIILGAPRGIILSDEEKRRTAYHESGHAIVGMMTPGADPVRKVSIIPRTMSLGVTISSPDNERTNYDVDYLLGRIRVALGGRIAEEVVYGSISAGAESDIQQLTGIARQMVGRWGMSQAIGPIAVIPSEANGPLLPGASEVSETTQQLIDSEVRRIVDEQYQVVTRLLTENRDKLDSLTERLLEEETLDMDDAYNAAGVPAPRVAATEEPSVA